MLWATGYPDPVTNIGATAGSIAYVDGSRTQHNVDLRRRTIPTLWSGTSIDVWLEWPTPRVRQSLLLSHCGKVPPLGIFAIRTSNIQTQWKEAYTTGSFGETKQSAAYVATQLNLSDALAVLVGLRLNEWKPTKITLKPATISTSATNSLLTSASHTL